MSKSAVSRVVMAAVCVAALQCRPAAAIAIGSQAPPINAAGWINGAQSIQPGHVVALEFWATW
ncbi:MAG: hypothetical protein ABSE73_07815 [Planctomycetota bacterium]